MKITKRIKRIFDKNAVFSIGENCMADDFLDRNRLKSFSSPYSSARSNIEYILAHEKEGFKDLLNKDYLCRELSGTSGVPRNLKYVDTSNCYHETVTNGFEFTHFDVISNSKAITTIKRRCKRMLQLRKKNVVMIYHHRLCRDTDIDLLVTNLSELADIYKNRANSVNIFLIMQEIVSDARDRKIEYDRVKGVNLYRVYSLNEWSGMDDELIMGRCDDDLLKVVADGIRRVLK